jgi:hypothetical protein
LLIQNPECEPAAEGDRSADVRARTVRQKASVRIGPVTFGSRQQIGNFLYVTDRNNGRGEDPELEQLLAHRFAEDLPPDPEGLGMSPDLKRLYVSNYGDDTVSIVGDGSVRAVLPPGDQPPEGRERSARGLGPNRRRRRVRGELPRQHGVDPRPEDADVRKTLTDANIKRPWDAVLSPRQLQHGLGAGIYFGYIGCQQTGKIVRLRIGSVGGDGHRRDEHPLGVANNGTFKDTAVA